jgi:hypothetical protein
MGYPTKKKNIGREARCKRGVRGIESGKKVPVHVEHSPKCERGKRKKEKNSNRNNTTTMGDPVRDTVKLFSPILSRTRVVYGMVLSNRLFICLHPHLPFSPTNLCFCCLFSQAPDSERADVEIKSKQPRKKPTEKAIGSVVWNVTHGPHTTCLLFFCEKEKYLQTGTWKK